MRFPYVIAEAGVNFYDTARVLGISPLAAAQLYVREAAAAGISAIKFQTYKANTLASKNSPAYWDLTKEPTTSQHALFQKFDAFNQADYETLAATCREAGIDFLSTPFDNESADYLDGLMDVYKISSSDLTNLPFIRRIARKGKPIFLSVGASYVHEIAEAVQAIEEIGCPQLCLMHCVLSYPTRYEDANLAVITTLGRLFPHLLLGYSDHTCPEPSMTVLSTAYLLGARVLEKHFTLDKTLPGNDHYHGGDPADFRRALENLRLIDTVMGSPEKTVLPCEVTPRREARRSLVLTHAKAKGEVLTEADVVQKRPGTGIPPKFRDVVVGRAVRADLPEDTILTWDMI